MDETVKETIIEINKDSKYLVAVPSWFTAKDAQRLHDALAGFLNDPDQVFYVISDGLKLQKIN